MLQEFKTQNSKLKTITQSLKVLTFTLSLFALTFTFYTSPAFAADCDNAASIAAGRGPCPAGLTEIERIVGNFISVVVGLGFIAMLVLILTAGFKYLTSGGEPKAIQAANQTMTWALLGVVFMAVAWVILQLIAGITGLPVTIFSIKSLCGDPNNPAQWFCP